MPSSTRPSPDELLRRVQAEEEFGSLGRLKVFLGYASGVGKSFRMLDEGRRRMKRGQDVVVGAVQPQTSPEVHELLKRIEVIPMRPMGENSAMDLDQILRRHPQVCLVDGLAYDNPPGSPNTHRWQDVQQLLTAGISVLTTINLQYVEERRLEIGRIRGKCVSVTVPEDFLKHADEIVVVDAPAALCVEKNDSGESGSVGGQQHKLSQLREIALLLAADVVERQLEGYLERQGLAQSWAIQERILVCITPRTNATRMIERARLVRDRFHGELFVVSVGQPNLSAKDQAALEVNLAVARAAGAHIQLLDSADPVTTIITFAREHGITQIFIGHALEEKTRIESLRARLTRTVDRLIQAADGMDVKLFPH